MYQNKFSFNVKLEVHYISGTTAIGEKERRRNIMPKYREAPGTTQGGSSNKHGILLTSISQNKRENTSGFSPPMHRLYYPQKLIEEKGKR
jgi:hypothetical protein